MILISIYIIAGDGKDSVASTLARIERKVDVTLRTSAGLALRSFDAYWNKTQNQCS